MPYRAPPSPILRFLAAACTSATAVFFMTQLMGEGQAAETPPPPPGAQVRVEPTSPDMVEPTRVAPPRTAEKPRGRVRKFLPVRDFGGY